MKTREAKEALVGAPGLATLRELDVRGGDLAHDGDWLARFLFESPLRRLRELDGVYPELFPRLLESAPPWSLERLHFAGAGSPDLVAAVADVTKQAVGLPHLRELALGYVHKREGAPPDDRYYTTDPVGRYGWLWETTFGRQLETLHVQRDPGCIVPWLPVLREHAGATRLQRVVFTWGAPFTLERTDAGWTTLRGVFPADPPPHLRGTLDRAIATLAAMGHALDVDVEGYEPPA